jgi:hypothetical protein
LRSLTVGRENWSSREALANGTTGVYFGDLPGGNKLEVSGTDIIPSQQDVVVRILRTIQAKDFKPIP